VSDDPRVLVVDDGDRYVELLHALLRDFRYATRCTLEGPCWTCPHREGCTLTHAHDWAEAREVLVRDRSVDVVLLDVRFDLPEQRLLGDAAEPLEDRQRLQGLRILEALRKLRPDLPVVLMTSETAIGLEHAAPLLADEYVTLAGDDAFDAQALASLVNRLVARRRRHDEDDGYVWGSSKAMRDLRHGVITRIRTELPLLVLGETGTGKSALAERVIHGTSARRRGPFVGVDLAALPDTLVASELFGSVKGAFSDAVDRPGRFEQAHGGTLFLDEIGNLPADAQRMLLLALQNGRVTRLGDTRVRDVDVRLVAATHVDLAAKVREGSFRADLYARLNPAMAFALPPLRDRVGDLRELAEALVRRRFADGRPRERLESYQRLVGVDGVARAGFVVGREETPRAGVAFVFSDESWTRMRAHRWPGNLRELEYFLASACLMTLEADLDAAEQGRAGLMGPRLHVAASLVRELLETSWVAPGVEPPRAVGSVAPQPHLKDVARQLERELFERLFAETEGDFEAMAARLLEGDPATNARRVRTRFNQLGLSARELRDGR